MKANNNENYTNKCTYGRRVLGAWQDVSVMMTMMMVLVIVLCRYSLVLDDAVAS